MGAVRDSGGRRRWFAAARSVLIVLLLAVLPVVTARAAEPRAHPAPRASPNPRGGVAIRSGDRLVPLELWLDLKAALVKPGGPNSLPEAPMLAWRVDGEARVWTARNANWEATLRFAPREGSRISLDVELRYAADMIVEREAIRIRLPGVASAVRRDLSYGPLGSPLRIDRGTPGFVASKVATLAAGPGFAAARFSPAYPAVGTIGADVDLILDDEASHPFTVYEKCLSKLPAAVQNDTGSRGSYAALEKRRPLSRRTRTAGEIVRAQASIYLTDPAAPPVPLIVERWPAGAKAAFVITDHADRTDPAGLRAILFGTSDKASPGYGRRGLFANGLKITKTFFARPRIGSLEEDAEARALADEIVAAGSEVGSHSITPAADPREIVEKGLATFDPWKVVTWVDHEPYTNCEAISNQGWEAGGAYGIRDLLLAHGYRWIWAATDLPEPKDSRLADLFGGDPAEAQPAVFPLPADPRLMVFRSVWFYEDPTRLAAALGDRALDDLERSRGLFVGHTYLAPTTTTTRIPDHRRRLAVRRNVQGALEIDPALEGALERLGARVKAGSIASLTWRETGDRLLDLGEIEVRYLADGSARILNLGSHAVPALTVAIPEKDAEFRLEGAQPIGTRHEGDRSTVWFDLPAGAEVALRAIRDERTLSLVAGGPVILEGP